MGTNDRSPLTILYVMGTPRSGSTILGSVLGELDGFFHVGEACYLWRGLQNQNRRRGCACGSPTVQECEVWSAILKQIVDRPGIVEEAWAGRGHYESPRNGAALVRGRGLSSDDHQFLEWYADLMSGLYRSISQVTGARVIVDSSKWPWDAAILKRYGITGATFSLLHLVRDSRAFAYSLQRRRRPLLPTGSLKMRKAQLVRDVRRWDRLNGLARSLYEGAPEESAMVLRYEDFAADPERTLSRITANLNEVPSPSPFIGFREARLSPQHNWGGNSLVWGSSGTVVVEPDREWHERMRLGDQAIATALTRRQLRHFGYPIKARTRSNRSTDDINRVGGAPH